MEPRGAVDEKKKEGELKRAAYTSKANEMRKLGQGKGKCKRLLSGIAGRKNAEGPERA